MKEEIAATVFFVARLAQKYGKLDRNSRDHFAVSFTSVLFEKFKNHWYPDNPTRGQAYRCIRVNKLQRRDPDVEQACHLCEVDYEALGLPLEMTIWVDPGEVSCRYGEKSTAFCVTQLEGQKSDGDFSRRINNAVERASSDCQSGASSDEEEDLSSLSSNSSLNSLLAPEHKTIPTVSNPNSVYQFGEFGPVPQPWNTFQKRKPYLGDSCQQHGPVNGVFPQHKGFKSFRPSFFTGPRVDKYHWVSKSRS